MEGDHLDEGMGVVVGVFHPNDNYLAIQSIVREKYSGQVSTMIEELELRAETEDGEQLEPIGGIVLLDFSLELPENARELHVNGLPREQFLRFWRDVYPDDVH